MLIITFVWVIECCFASQLHEYYTWDRHYGSSWPRFYGQYSTKPMGVITTETGLVIGIEYKCYQWTCHFSCLILLSFAIQVMIFQSSFRQMQLLLTVHNIFHCILKPWQRRWVEYGSYSQGWWSQMGMCIFEGQWSRHVNMKRNGGWELRKITLL